MEFFYPALSKIKDSIAQLKLPIIIPTIALFFALIDTFIKPVSLTTLGLVALATLPWLVQFIRTMELPGGFKFEFRDLERVTKRAAEAGLLKAPDTSDTAIRPPHEFEFVDDPNLALAGIRIEIERRLRRMANISGFDAHHRSLSQILSNLENSEILRIQEIGALKDILPTLNRAVHAASDLDMRMAHWAITVGPQILAALDDKLRTLENHEK